MPNTFDHQVILLVDDENSTRFMVGQMLRRLGFAEVVTANDGLQAVDLLNTRRDISIVLTDFRMPGLHGLQLLKMIRTGQTQMARNLPCALITSYAERHLVGLAIVLDVDTFLAKPVSFETLNKHLTRCFQYRFEPLGVNTYEGVDVDNAAPHLMDAMFTPPLPEAKPPEATPTEPAAEPTAEPVAAPAPPPEAKAPEQKSPEQPPAPQQPQRAPAAPPAPPSKAKAAPPPEKKPAASKPTPVRQSSNTEASEYGDKPRKKVSLADVPENAVLAQDLVGAGGTLLLAAGTRFKARYAKRIEELHSIKEKVEYVWIVDE